LKSLDSGLRRNDGKQQFLTFCETIKLDDFAKKGKTPALSSRAQREISEIIERFLAALLEMTEIDFCEFIKLVSLIYFHNLPGQLHWRKSWVDIQYIAIKRILRSG